MAAAAAAPAAPGNGSRRQSSESAGYGFESDEFSAPENDSEFVGGFGRSPPGSVVMRHKSSQGSLQSATSRATVWGGVEPGEGGADALHDNFVQHDWHGTRRLVPDHSKQIASDDLARMDMLTDDTLLDTLDERLAAGRIYTYVGDILIAINPYADLGMYSTEHSLLYTSVVDPAAVAPHIFAVADRCYTALSRSFDSQICVISGESGSGKTESTKLFIRQVLDVASAEARGSLKRRASNVSAGSARSTVSEAAHPVEAKILGLNPILESFGNARTVMNNNSSRFGKLVELVFNRRGAVSGARLSHFLLEKARLVVQGPGESNFHVFRRFLAGASTELLARYRLDAAYEYRVLPTEPTNDDGDTAGFDEGVDEWTALMESLGVVGISDTQAEEILAALSAMLVLGEVRCEMAEGGEGSFINAVGAADDAAAVLAVDADALIYTFTKSEMTTRGETIVKNRSQDAASATRDALVKAIYERLFMWIVRKLDRLLRPRETAADDVKSSADLQTAKIGILDIFGFENFATNGFGQMCINLANERLHFFFNKHIFQAETTAYVEEGLDLAKICFSDNSSVIDLFTGRPAGLLALLDEESRFPKATERTLLEKFEANIKDAQRIFAVATGQGTFSVTHFAGVVKYCGDDFLEANRDPLPEDTVKLMGTSASLLIGELFSEGYLDPNYSAEKRDRPKSRFASMTSRIFGSKRSMRASRSAASSSVRKSSGGAAPGGRKTRRGGNRPATVVGSFKDSLDSLLTLMEASRPHFLRCIKPNASKRATLFEREYVRRQLSYCGMLETVRIRREGYAHRLLFADFFVQYRGLALPYTDGPKGEDLSAVFRGGPSARQRDILSQILTHAEKMLGTGQDCGALTLAGWQIGKTKVFLKYWHLDLLNKLMVLQDRAASRLQRFFRAARDRLLFLRLLEKSRVQALDALEFLVTVRQCADKVVTRQQCCTDEDERRGPFGLPAAAQQAKVERTRGNIAGTKQGFKIAGKDKKAAWKWWMKAERPRHAHCTDTGVVQPWFHGQIHRDDAEALLQGCPDGTYLVRVSDRSEGYAISLWFETRVRHYKVTLFEQRYQMLGETRNHDFASLAELIEYHQGIAISVSIGDTLARPLPIGTRGNQFCHIGLAEELQLTPEGVDPCPRVAASSEEPLRRERLRRSDSSESISSHVVLSEKETEEEPLDPNTYLMPETVAGYNKPPWLYGKIDRQQSTEIIANMAMPDGAFLIREKMFTSQRAVYVLTYCLKKRIYHHKLEWDRRNWRIEGSDTGHTGPLESLVDLFMESRYPQLWTQLIIPRPREGKTKGPVPRPPSISRIPGKVAPRPPSVSRIPGRRRHDSGLAAAGVTGGDHYEYQETSPGDALYAEPEAFVENGGMEPDIGLPSIIRKQPKVKPKHSKDKLEIEVRPGPGGAPHVTLAPCTYETPVSNPRPNASGGLYETPSPVNRRVRQRVSMKGRGHAFGATGAGVVGPGGDELSAFYVNKKMGKQSAEAQLARCAKRGQVDKARELLRSTGPSGINVDAIRRNGSGRTPLFYAAQGGHLEVVQLLLDHGADTTTRDISGHSIVSAAANGGHHDVLLVLKRAVFAPGGHQLLSQIRANQR